MFFRRCASLVLALAVSACASSGDTSSGEGRQTAERAARGSSTLIIRAELERFPGQSAYDVIESLHRRWIERRRAGRGQLFAGVMIDGTIRAEIGDLRRLYSETIETMRYISASAATLKYGGGFPGGVIEVVTRRGPTRR